MNRLQTMKAIVLAGGLLVVPVVSTFAQSELPARPRMVKVKQWSNSKTKDQRRMFPVEPGERITFSADVPGAEQYQWQVHKKVDAEVRRDSFTWTVPDKKAIWEIHLKVMGGGSEAHQEWVVSTLSADEAPELFEYFTDGKFKDRTEHDPWGRPLPRWHVARGVCGEWIKGNIRMGSRPDLPPDVSRCFMAPGEEKGTGQYGLRTESKTAYGTWRLKFRFPAGFFVPAPGGGSGPRTELRFEFINPRDTLPYFYQKTSDGHNYFSRPTGTGGGIILGSCQSSFRQDMGWYTLTIIRTRDGSIRNYITDLDTGRTDLQFRGHDPEADNSTHVDVRLLRPLWDMFPRVTLYVDAVEMYRDRYLFPEKSARFEEYVDRWKLSDKPIVTPEVTALRAFWANYEMKDWTDEQLAEMGARGHVPDFFTTRGRKKLLKDWKGPQGCMRANRFYAVYRKGIVVQGQGMTLPEIARMLDDSDLLHYDEKKQAWICRADLVVDEGAELLVKDTTLRMHCEKPGQHKIAVKYGANLRVENSTITSDTPAHYIWQFTGYANHGYNLGMRTLGSLLLTTATRGFNSIFIRKSKIDNCGNLFIETPHHLEITDSEITRLHPWDVGDYPARGTPFHAAPLQLPSLGGPKSFCFLLEPTQEGWANFAPLLKFDLNRVKFSSAENAAGPVDATFMVPSVWNRFTLYNCDFGDVRVVAMKTGVLGLVNCRFRQLVPGTAEAGFFPRSYKADAALVPRYYLDVLSEPGAKVSVVNEQDDRNFPAENAACEVGRPTADQPKAPWCVRLGVPLRQTLVGKDGRTPLPSDKEHTLILTDYELRLSGKKEFTYTITVEKNGKKKVITGVNPGPHWQRPDPNVPTYTITAVLDGKTQAEAASKTKGLAGRAKESSTQLLKRNAR